jgi:hypothetical protein
MMKVFYSNDFEGMWPVGTAAVVVAEDEQDAKLLLGAEIKWTNNRDFTVQELDLSERKAVILNNGDY